MWLVAVLVIGAFVPIGADFSGKSYSGSGDDYDGYNRYPEGISSLSMVPMTGTQYTWARKSEQTTPPVRTLSGQELREVRGVLNKMMAGRDLRMLTATANSVTDLRGLVDLISSSTADYATDLSQITALSTLPHYDDERPHRPERPESALRQAHRENHLGNVTVSGWVFQKHVGFRLILPTKYHYPLFSKYYYSWAERDEMTDDCLKMCAEDLVCQSANVDHYYYYCYLYRYNRHSEGMLLKIYWYWNYYERLGPEPITTDEPSTSNTTLGPTTETPIIDINKLVEIIANLTMNTIESNLTELFNATLQKYGIPMCGQTTTTEAPTYDFANATIVSKCFVCGLEAGGIPYNAYCADAFSGDFLPLVPVDPRAKGHIARYRKYCRYLDVPGMIVNETQPRSVFGRWTGGCSVRWIDLSGVYTQRACRNRRRAVMGQHFVSKRMAKLEMALRDEDNGCIISPMASLVPLSRGISIYARFHACVCTGEWCNKAIHILSMHTAWLKAIATLTVVALVSS